MTDEVSKTLEESGLVDGTRVHIKLKGRGMFAFDEFTDDEWDVLRAYLETLSHPKAKALVGR